MGLFFRTHRTRIWTSWGAYRVATHKNAARPRRCHAAQTCIELWGHISGSGRNWRPTVWIIFIGGCYTTSRNEYCFDLAGTYRERQKVSQIGATVKKCKHGRQTGGRQMHVSLCHVWLFSGIRLEREKERLGPQGVAGCGRGGGRKMYQYIVNSAAP